jgi:hypothetical protein
LSGPLGKHSQLVAAVVALAIILAQISVWTAQAFGLAVAPPTGLEQAFYVAIGAVFGAAATTAVNGQTIEAAHRRLDRIAAPPSGGGGEAETVHEIDQEHH